MNTAPGTDAADSRQYDTRTRIVSLFKDVEGVEILRCTRDHMGYQQRTYNWLTEASEKRLYRLLHSSLVRPMMSSGSISYYNVSHPRW